MTLARLDRGKAVGDCSRCPRWRADLRNGRNPRTNKVLCCSVRKAVFFGRVPISCNTKWQVHCWLAWFPDGRWSGGNHSRVRLQVDRLSRISVQRYEAGCSGASLHQNVSAIITVLSQMNTSDACGISHSTTLSCTRSGSTMISWILSMSSISICFWKTLQT